jgi:hypothetical protein
LLEWLWLRFVQRPVGYAHRCQKNWRAADRRRQGGIRSKVAEAFRRTSAVLPALDSWWPKW